MFGVKNHYMKSTILKVFMCIAMLATAFSTLHAQEIITVSGKILNKPEGKSKPEPFPAGERVYIFAFHTVAAAKDAMQLLEAGDPNVMSDATEFAGSDGYYEIRVAENGALVVRAAMKNTLIEVKGRDVINHQVEGAIELGTVEVVALATRPKPKPVAGKIVGGKLIVDNTIVIPDKYGAPNRRLIMQPMVIDCNTEDTVKFIDPVVMDGAEYDLTQARRMAFDMQNDVLDKFINKRRKLNEDRFDLGIKDSVLVPDPKRTYIVHAKVIIADYTHETYTDEWKLTTCKIKRPMQFLEFSFPDFQLDPYKYQEKPRREKMDTAEDISLTFALNKAELDPEDPNNEILMAKLLGDLNAIMNGEGTTLKEFRIKGISSPEGRYAPNLALAERRTAYALNLIKSQVPAGKWARVLVHKPEARVATWDEMADLLEQDTLLNEAAEIRAITAKYDSHDAQYADIRRLPYYETLIKDRLPRLRKLQYEYVQEIFRELKPHEILYRYQNDPEYRDGRKAFTKYEYWHLFQQIKDPKEAEKIYRRAYKDHMEKDLKGNKKPWMLAANNLAVSLLRRDTFDVEILQPLINYTRPVNTIDRFDDGLSVIETEINPEDVVANQLAMFIRANNFEDASILADKLPKTDKFKMVKAFASCLGGYYDYRGASSVEEQKERREIFDLVKNSTPMNHAVMCMAMEMGNFDKEAKEVLDQMEQTTQVKYMKLQLFIREKKLHDDPKLVEPFSDEEEAFKEACRMLDAIIKEDPKYRKIAENDGEISTEFMEYFADPMNWEDLMNMDF